MNDDALLLEKLVFHCDVLISRGWLGNKDEWEGSDARGSSFAGVGNQRKSLPFGLYYWSVGHSHTVCKKRYDFPRGWPKLDRRKLLVSWVPSALSTCGMRNCTSAGEVYWPRTGTLGDEELTVDRLRNWLLKMCMFKLVQDTCSNPCKFVIRSWMFHIGKTLHLGDSTEFQVPVSPTSLPTDSPKVFCFLGCNPKYHWCWKTTSNQIQFLDQFPDPSAKNSHSSCSSTFKIFQDLNN